MKKHERESGRTKIVVIAVSIVVAVGLGIGAYFGAKTIYDNGVKDGRQTEAEEISAQVRALGVAVSEKADFQKTVNEIFTELPREVNSEGVDGYIAKLEELNNKINVESVKTKISEYMAKWQAFKEVYASENNDKIAESFNELKDTAADAAQQIKSLYDEAIKNAIQNL